MYSIKNREDFKNLEELSSLPDKVEEVLLQDKLGQQNFHEYTKKIIDPVIDAIKNISATLTKTLIESSFRNNQALEILNEKVLVLLNDKGVIAPCVPPSLVKLFKPENKSQFFLT